MRLLVLRIVDVDTEEARNERKWGGQILVTAMETRMGSPSDHVRLNASIAEALVTTLTLLTVEGEPKVEQTNGPRPKADICLKT